MIKLGHKHCYHYHFIDSPKVPCSDLGRIFSHSRLSELYLFGTTVTGEELEPQTVNASSLQVLELVGSKSLTDKGFLNILRICGENLKHLNLHRTGISGVGVSTISLPQLQVLNLRKCVNLTEQGLLEILSVCRSTLQNLELSKVSISGKALAAFPGVLSNIKSLILQGPCYLTEEGLKQLTRICRTNLKSLDLSISSISSSELGMMLSYEWPELEDLDLESCRFSEIGTTGSTITLPKIKRLNLKKCDSLTDMGLFTILSKCGECLEALLLQSYRVAISGKPLSLFPRSMPKLAKLDLSSCPNLPSEGLAGFLHVFGHGLKYLRLGGHNYCDNISKEEVLPSLSNLEVLDCSDFCNLTDEGLVVLLSVCGDKLKKLDLSRTQVSGELLASFIKTFPCMEELNLAGCSVTTEGLLNLLSICWDSVRSLNLDYFRGHLLPEFCGILPNISTLSLCSSKVTNVDLKWILSLCGNQLESLNIGGCRHLNCFQDLKVDGDVLSFNLKTVIDSWISRFRADY